ncbi:MAG: ATP-dependent DNA ligase [candidate division WOR-3 bacterium]|nr:ATP-dependent DNA ligase [candidate division WOR-3 bacterium]
MKNQDNHKRKQKSRFVLHKHWATHLHWDFRLEKDGMLKSWAVPKGLPEKSGIRRLAIQVEDHDLDYIDFQGIITEGYGTGKVKIEDNGNYESLEFEKDRIRFFLNGKKFKGGYTLFRMKDSQWLISKWKD